MTRTFVGVVMALGMMLGSTGDVMAARLQSVEQQLWGIGVHGPFGPYVVNPSMDSIDVYLVPDTADWLLDAALPVEARRTIEFVVERSFDNGNTWSHWAGATFRTGAFPRSGILSFGVTNGDRGSRRTRISWTVSNGPVIFGVDYDISRRF